MLNGEDEIPRLRKVIVASGSTVAIGDNIEEALTNLFTDYAIDIDVLDMEDMSAIIDSIKTTLEKTPPELAADIMEKGIMLAGGGALLRNLDALINYETHMPVHIAEQPLDCVALGAGKALENFDRIAKNQRGY